MADSNPIIVGSGIGAGPTFVLGHLTVVAQASPPIIGSTTPVAVLDGAVTVISFPNSANVYNTIVGATETVRIQGGMIVSGAGTDTVQIGRAAAATANHSTVIGTLAADNGQVGVLVGYGTSFNLAAGVVIGNGSSMTGNAAGSTGVVVGVAASGNVLAGAGCVVLGDGAVGRTSDVVVGFNASSSLTDAFGASNVVIGTNAAANIASGTCVVIGTAATGSVKFAVVVGGASSVAIQYGIVVGYNSHITAAGAGSIIIGRGCTVSAAANIILGDNFNSSTPNLAWFGTPDTKIIAWILGEGDTVASPVARYIRYTNASGANNAAADAYFLAPVSTGNAAAGRFIFQIGKVGASSATLQTLTTQLIIDDGGIRTTLLTYTEAKTNPAVSAGTLTLDLSASNTFRVALSASATTLTISNPAASGLVQSFTLIVDVGGAFSITWPASVHWAGGVAPTQSAAAGKTDIFSFVTTDGGTTWYGFTGGLTYVT